MSQLRLVNKEMPKLPLPSGKTILNRTATALFAVVCCLSGAFFHYCIEEPPARFAQRQLPGLLGTDDR